MTKDQVDEGFSQHKVGDLELWEYESLGTPNGLDGGIQPWKHQVAQHYQYQEAPQSQWSQHGEVHHVGRKSSLSLAL